MIDPNAIRSFFGDIAPRYDNANAVLSFNLHKGWNKKLVKETTKNNPEVLLDLCAGTGEIAYLWLKNQTDLKKAILLDFCPEMLDIAKQRRPKKHRLSYIVGDAQAIPIPDHCVDAVSVAYGIRNVKSPKTCFKEVMRVLKPGGTFGILELTEPQNPIIKAGHRLYLEKILPVLGGMITKKPDAYKYLSSSIQAFVKPQVLVESLKEAGFQNIKVTSLTFGISHLITATKEV